MAILDSIARLATTLLDILQTRLELVSVEVEEELARYATYLVLVLIALFCAGIAVLLCLLLVIALFWDSSYRLAVLFALIALFAGSSIGLGLWLRQALRSKPRLFAHTLAELGKDKSALQAGSPAAQPAAGD
ncbi:MAG: phage holin family protein [Pseudomonadota bacterium]